jgi:hypothetical protein
MSESKKTTEQIIAEIRNQILGPVTDEQLKKIPEYINKYVHYARYQGPTDKPKAEEAIRALYKANGIDNVTVTWADSPRKAMEIAAKLSLGKSEVSQSEISSMADGVETIQNDKIWIAIYEFMVDYMGIPREPNMEILKNIAEYCGMYWPFVDEVVMCVRPLEVHFDSDQKLHNESGPAVLYPDGSAIFALNGQIYSTLADYMMARSALHASAKNQ